MAKDKFMSLKEMQEERSLAETDYSRQWWQNAIDNYFLHGTRIPVYNLF